MSSVISIKVVSSQDELEMCFSVRLAVFVREQKCPESEEFDDADARAVHVLALDGGRPVGTGRFYDEDGAARIGRMAVLSSHRGRGVGRLVMEELLRRAKDAGAKRAVLHAQLHARDFYVKFGFVPEGEVFDECGIDHVKMARTL